MFSLLPDHFQDVSAIRPVCLAKYPVLDHPDYCSCNLGIESTNTNIYKYKYNALMFSFLPNHFQDVRQSESQRKHPLLIIIIIALAVDMIKHAPVLTFLTTVVSYNLEPLAVYNFVAEDFYISTQLFLQND